MQQMLRDPLQARLPDVAVPACVLSAWLVPVMWRTRRPRMAARVAVAASVVAGLFMVVVAADPMDHLDRADLRPTPTFTQVVNLVREHHAELATPLAPRNFSTGAMEGLVPFFEYVSRCTAPDDRIFVAGELPEVFIHAGRMFAGGQPALRDGFFDTPSDQARLVSRLRRQRVPLVLVVTDGDIAHFPIVVAELEARFQPLTTIPFRGHSDLALLGSRTMTTYGTDPAMGLPCFR